MEIVEKEINLTKQEYNLILLIRNKYRYGEIVIICKDGKPLRVKKAEVFDELCNNLD